MLSTGAKKATLLETFAKHSKQGMVQLGVKMDRIEPGHEWLRSNPILWSGSITGPRPNLIEKIGLIRVGPMIKIFDPTDYSI